MGSNQPDPGKPRLLLVDDEEEFTSSVARILSRRGYRVEAVNSGQMALHAIEESEFDVAVLDLRMPGMSGLETLEAIKKRQPLLEVVMLTGHGSVETGLQGMELGAFDYASKPIQLDELIEKISMAYERKRIHQEKLKGLDPQPA